MNVTAKEHAEERAFRSKAGGLEPRKPAGFERRNVDGKRPAMETGEALREQGAGSRGIIGNNRSQQVVAVPGTPKAIGTSGDHPRAFGRACEERQQEMAAIRAEDDAVHSGDGWKIGSGRWAGICGESGEAPGSTVALMRTRR